jgi:hypothetical protein
VPKGKRNNPSPTNSTHPMASRKTMPLSCMASTQSLLQVVPKIRGWAFSRCSQVRIRLALSSMRSAPEFA